MGIKQNSIVTMHYSIRDNEKKLLETTYNSTPLQFMVGIGLFLPSIEARIMGMNHGEKAFFIIPPGDGYGKKDKNLIIKIPIEELPDGNIKVGSTLWRGSAKGDRTSFTVTGFLDKWVFLDGNHPWAGMELHYEVEILRVSRNTLLQHLKI
ncbi:MAG TPA: hypothetical protein DD405_02220 [Desulfobacteraceae bacterium]|nr:hypothetical protein [Desulfobacteraceae bacterium]